MAETLKPDDSSTKLAFQRTWMSAERTLMASLRTALSLIGFGFTIFQFFSHLKETNVLTDVGHTPNHLGLAMVLLGNALLIAAIIQHRQFMALFGSQRNQIAEDGPIGSAGTTPVSAALIVALLLLVLGLLATTSMILGWP